MDTVADAGLPFSYHSKVCPNLGPGYTDNIITNIIL